MFTTAAVFVTAPTEARILGITAGIIGVVGGFAWVLAAVKG